MHAYSEKDRERRLVKEPGKLGPLPDDGVVRCAFGRDYDRVLHSGAFRRLQGKTQVVDPWEGDFFRTRLTHSLECCQIASALARRTGANPNLLQAVACAHDIGNPPFGHNGEDALEDMMKDYGGFEGNAQSFRVVSRLESKFGQLSQRGITFRPGLNLSRAVLSSMMKYPWRRAEPGMPDTYGDVRNKFNYYSEDRQAFDFAVEDLPKFGRRFEGSLAEWADDVAYAVHDLEDGIRARFINMHSLRQSDREQWRVAENAKRILKKARPTSISESQIPEMLSDLLTGSFFEWASSSFEATEPQKARVKRCTSSFIEYFVRNVPERDDYDLSDGIGVPDEVYVQNRLLYAITWTYVISRRELSTVQIGQQRIVKGLFEAFIDCKQDKLASLLPEPLGAMCRKYGHTERGKARCVCDHIAGMTDRYAVQLYDRMVLGRGSVKDIL